MLLSFWTLLCIVSSALTFPIASLGKRELAKKETALNVSCSRRDFTQPVCLPGQTAMMLTVTLGFLDRSSGCASGN
jgi:hypothetical protein